MSNVIIQVFNEWIPRRAVLFILMLLVGMYPHIMRTLVVNIILHIENDERRNVSQLHDKSLSNHETKLVYDSNQITSAIAFSFGMMIAGIPAGIFAEKFGGASVVNYAIFVPAALNLLLPWCSTIPYNLLYVLRFILGFSAGAIYPAFNTVIARWVPPDEKGLFMWTIQSGSFGTSLTFYIFSNIIDRSNWKIAYWCSSVFLFIFHWLWTNFIHDTPDSHPTITSVEKNYIKNKIGLYVSDEEKKYPLRAIFTSVPFLVLLYTHLVNTWGTYFIITSLICRWVILDTSAQILGLLSILFHIPIVLVGFLYACVGDLCHKSKLIKIENSRQFFMFLSHFVPSIILAVEYMRCNELPSLMTIIMVQFMNSAACQSSMQNQHDLAPNFAGILFGIMSTVSSFFDLLVLIAIGKHTSIATDMEWCTVVGNLACLYFSASLLFFVMGSTRVQRWNKNSESTSADLIESNEVNELGLNNAAFHKK